MSDRARGAGSYGRAAAEPLLDELASQAGELSKRWAIALIEGRGPEQIAAVDLTLLASEGPELIDAVLSGAAQASAGGVRAPGGALARIAGAGGGGELARAAEALRGVLWEAAVEASPRARSDTRAARRLLELGDGISAACAELLASELDRLSEQGPAAGRAETPAAAASEAARPAVTEPILIVDERHGEEPRAAGARPGRAPESPPATIAARDARPHQGPAAWIGSIGAQLAAFEQDRHPFSVLLIEVLEPPAALDPEASTRALERSIEQRLGGWRGLSVTREGPGRYWLIAPGADGAGAESLRERLEAAAGEGGPVAVGVAVCPDDGRDAPGLAAHADLDLYASRVRSSAPRARRTERS